MPVTGQRRLPWYVWQIGSLVAFAIAALGAVGEWLEWWDMLGEIVLLGTTFTVLGLVLAVHGASARAILRVETALEDITERLGTIDVVLGREMPSIRAAVIRIEALLNDRASHE